MISHQGYGPQTITTFPVKVVVPLGPVVYVQGRSSCFYQFGEKLR